MGKGGIVIFDVTTDISVKVEHPSIHSRKFLELNSKDIALMFFLEKHRVAARTQLHYVLTKYYDRYSNLHSFNNRWDKLEELKLVSSKILKLNNSGSKRKILRLTSRGIALLKELGLLPEDYNEAAIKQAFDRQRWDHTLTIREMLVRGLGGIKEVHEHVDIKSTFDYKQIKSLNPAYHSFTHPVEGTTFVKPGWLLAFETDIACLEADTGTENFAQLQRKMNNYLDMVKSYPNQNYTVVFGVVDDTFPTMHYYGEDRSLRISNIKEMITERVPALVNSPLEIKVCSLARTPFVVPSSIVFRPMTPSIRTALMRNAQRFLSRVPNYPFEHVALENMEAELDRIEQVMGVRPDWMIREVNPHTKESFHSVFIMLREGDVKSVGRLLKLSKQDGWEEILGIGRVYGIYHTEEELLHDIVPNKLDNHVYFSSVKVLGDSERTTYLYQRTSSSRLVGVDFR